jgi:ankyrin repeat protein
MQLLLQNGTAVNFCNDDKWTPLILVLQYGHLDTAQLLLNYRVNIKWAKETPLDLLLANEKLKHL